MSKITHARREALKAWRLTVIARDTQCRYPQCRSRSTDAHHLIGRGSGGTSTNKAVDLNNGVGLCSHHHQQITIHAAPDWRVWTIPRNQYGDRWLANGGQSNPEWLPNTSNYEPTASVDWSGDPSMEGLPW